ncbi:lipocalin family protein [Paraburkholderia acidisoli]|uniref:Outer membrane lipoprotein Blc n=1 Tax=Paraburkholderia acidisoli TaxID=2571748 RepID=A0A7Z2JKW6_9BURK|nr:lipocalin family protein [Paraburkholderia acidisoli]QGZ66699.1 lipocalin [Paraburkholderia acidisoli]
MKDEDRIHPAWLALGALAVGAVLVKKSGAFAGGPRGNRRVPEPLKPVDLDRYAGRWFEFARYDNRFERGCEGVMAQYAKRGDGLIDVLNLCREGSASGPIRAARGRAKVVAGSGNAKLKVSFFGPFYVGHYWVLDHADDYRWSIVGEPSGRFLWILTRDAEPDARTAKELVGRARELGYDTSLLRFTAQRHEHEAHERLAS